MTDCFLFFLKNKIICSVDFIYIELFIYIYIYIYTHTHTHTRTHTYIYIYIYVCVCVCVIRQKGLISTQKERPSLNFLWQRTTTSYRTRKTNSVFYFNFCAGDVHTKVSGWGR